MSQESSKGEHADESREGRPRPSAERAVQARLEKIQREKRSGVRWKLSRHTAEQAMLAIADVAPRAEHRPSSKSRRRKRHKRLL